MRQHPSSNAGNLATVTIEQETLARPAEYPNRYATIPPNGRRCEFTGLGHAKLYQILGSDGIARCKVRVANLRMPGTVRGQTLFHVGDMLRFLDELAQHTAIEQAANKASASTN